MRRLSLVRPLLLHWRLCLFIGLVAIAFFIYQAPGVQAELRALLHPSTISGTRERVLGLGWRGVATFLLSYAVAVSFGIPNLPFQLAAGAIWGVWKSFLMMYLGANVGALGALALARLLGRRSLEHLLGERLQITGRIESGGFRLLLILRLIPLIPFNALNYACGVSRLSVRKFMAANALGILPLTYLHVLLGHGAGKYHLMDPRSWLHPEIAVPILVAGALLLTASVLQRRWRKRKGLPPV